MVVNWLYIESEGSALTELFSASRNRSLTVTALSGVVCVGKRQSLYKHVSTMPQGNTVFQTQDIARTLRKRAVQANGWLDIVQAGVQYPPKGFAVFALKHGNVVARNLI